MRAPTVLNFFPNTWGQHANTGGGNPGGDVGEVIS